MSEEKLASALAKAAVEFPTIAMDKTNPHFKSRYASLEAIISCVTPILSSHGLSVTQTFEVTEHGNSILLTTLRHESGEVVESRLPLVHDKQGRNAMQAMGSAVTYARRYALSAILGTSAGVKHEEDDDANRCNPPPQTMAPKPKPQAPEQPTPGTKINECQTPEVLRMLLATWVQGRPVADNIANWSGIMPLVDIKINSEGDNWQDIEGLEKLLVTIDEQLKTEVEY